MICIKCGRNNTSVINSRQNKKTSTVWRRRKCKDCGQIYTTYEDVAIDQILVISDIDSLPFHHAKLLISIANCFEHIPVKRAENAEALAKTVEAKLLYAGNKTTPEAISVAVYASLKHFDRLASVQYAAKHSIYLKKHLRV
ncbi:MAG: hypothetical protein Q7T74_02620 [Candidatus Saccharibacteria bacterium]|nr:hypothetical protein [Candidatus Saccharibacteria bacterium]